MKPQERINHATVTVQQKKEEGKTVQNQQNDRYQHTPLNNSED